MPTEKCCGTCKWWKKVNDRITPIGHCTVPLPVSVGGWCRSAQLSTKGTNCPCWESGNNTWRGPHIGPPAQVMPIPTATGEVKIMPLQKEGRG